MLINKNAFITEIEQAIKQYNIDLSDEAKKYFTTLKNEDKTPTGKNKFTNNGVKIIQFMRQQEIESPGVNCTAKEIGEILDLPTRAVSSSLRKMVLDGFVAKVENTQPFYYVLTDLGRYTTLN